MTSITSRCIVAHAHRLREESRQRVQKLLKETGITPRSRRVSPTHDAENQAQYDEQSAYWDRIYAGKNVDFLA